MNEIRRQKVKAQVKSRFYYWFWGLATISVFSGQMYVGSGYRQMSRTAEDGVNGLPGKQVDARNCIVNGTGGSLSTTGTLILEADDA